MDKKNTMLLTVIAVATLLVAVVGATFAYFSVTGANTTTTTGVEVTAEESGTVALAGGEELHITLSAADMSEALKGTGKYYATNVADEAYKTSATPYTVAEATVTGGEAATKYTCTFDLTATVGGDMTLTSGDAQLVLSGAVSETYDLSGGTKTWNVTMNQLTGTNTTQNVQAYVVFNNTEVEQQTGVAGKTLTVDLTSTDFACDTNA